MTKKPKSLEDVRLEIDEIDASLLALIKRRTEIVEHVSHLKRNDDIKIRPAREAQVLYRLMELHDGPFPRRELCRIWRELIVATLSFEGPFSVAVCDNENEPGYWDLARDQYGSFTPITRHASARRVVDAVRNQDATVGVLPWPSHDGADPWWRYLIADAPETPRVIARLPFIEGSNARGGAPDAAVICPIEQQPSGRDRSFLAFETDQDIGFGPLEKALNKVGFSTVFHQVWHDPDRPPGWIYVVEVLGYVDPNGKQFPRLIDTLGRGATRILHLGGYATPLEPGELEP